MPSSGRNYPVATGSFWPLAALCAASIDDSLDEARIIERALLRIKAIGLAKGADEVTYRLGRVSG